MTNTNTNTDTNTITGDEETNTNTNTQNVEEGTNRNHFVNQLPDKTNPNIESLIFNSLVNSLNNELPNTRTTANLIHPNILEVSYSTENVSNDIVNFIRGLNDGETPSNIITTHATISRNTEVIVKGADEETYFRRNRIFIK